MSTTKPDAIVARFAGDSGDGVQLIGAQFSQATALNQNSLSTFPDFPAEIRAPVGTTYGVSAFQIQFGSQTIKTSGDLPDLLVALNPAALKVNYKELRVGGMIILDSGSFTERNLKKATFTEDPRKDKTLSEYQVLEIDISRLTLEATRSFEVTQKEALRAKNMWTLGLVYWMHGHEVTATEDFVRKKFGAESHIAQANIAALKAGHAYGETAEITGDMSSTRMAPVDFLPGEYRLVTGAEALAWGLLVGCKLAKLDMTFCSYPITPSSPILHILSKLKNFGITTFQAEDEIAAACSAIGASYAGNMGITASSGPGIALKTEAIGLAISTELPLVVVDTQRAGPSTGLPTKTEQSDLFLAVWGRNGDASLPVLCARSPSDCFSMAIEAVRLATKYMTPVFLLSDGYIANAAEPWLIPNLSDFQAFPVSFRTDPKGFKPFNRDAKTMSRPWAKPGTPGLAHRIGGIEKADGSGDISYDPQNHQLMTNLRSGKITGIAEDIPAQAVELGGSSGELVVVGWGSTYGPINRAVSNLRSVGIDVSHVHLNYIWPLPVNFLDQLGAYKTVLVAEMNNGQLLTFLRSQTRQKLYGHLKVTGQPLTITEIEIAIKTYLEPSVDSRKDH
ncbi:MAG: 2-oxoglutarate ferredoxin oxidoreductase subunit alpha [Rhodospirillaceae bacterium]|nr:2-oxoglutarate ferredoxin oxidoreductase subunit alpha [Rhodospirillaceae bacterium]